MNLNACALTLLLAGTGLAAAQSRVLYDNRLPTPEPRITESERGYIEYLAEQAAKLRLWDDGDYRPSEQCDGKDFSIDGVAPGSFTAKGVQQTAYLYTYCWVSHVGISQGVVIMQGKNAVAHYIFEDKYQALYSLKDVNKNGFTELALEGTSFEQGLLSKWLDIAELNPARRYLAQLTAYDDDCGAVGIAGTTANQVKWQSQVIRVTPALTPKYTAQTISGKCGNERVATKVGSIRPITVKAVPTGWTPAPLK